MRTHIDWVTFTMTPVYRSHYPDDMSMEDVYADGLLGAWELTFGDTILALAFGGKWEKRERSRAPYTDAWELADKGIALYASPTLLHCCVEISGQGCERLIKLDALSEILRLVGERATRIDIACDIETETRPLEFVGSLKHERMRASGHQLSETGETCYVGSQKSDRYARVYRYFAPHPRAHLLRVEHVFRKDYAKQVAQLCAEGNLEAVAEAAGRVFGWGSVVWQPADTASVDLRGVGSDRKSSSTVAWLLTACAPAFKRLVASGEILDAESFLREHFLGV